MLTIDEKNKRVHYEGRDIPLYSEEAFHLLSRLWLKVGWNAHYHYTFTWLGRPILQLPEDIVRLQEAIYALKPDVIIETGVALGGSMLFYASLCQLMGKGKVVGIDIDLRPQNAKALKENSLAPFITLIEGDSTEETTLSQVRECISPGEKVFVILDSNHGKEHVLKELELYGPLVSSGSYLVVADGFKQDLTDTPRGKPHWSEDHPLAAVEIYLENHPEFVLEYPEKGYNKSSVREPVTHLMGGWLKKL